MRIGAKDALKGDDVAAVGHQGQVRCEKKKSGDCQLFVMAREYRVASAMCQ